MKGINFSCSCLRKNPQVLLLLGACPLVAVSTGLLPALALGIITLLVMVLTSLVLGLLKKLIPSEARVAAAVLVAAIFVSVFEMVLALVLPAVYQQISVYLAVSAVSGMIYVCANAAFDSADAVKLSGKTGLIFTVVGAAMAIIRELFGSASICGISVPFLKDFCISTLNQSSGGLVLFAIALAVVSKIMKGKVSADDN